MSSTDWGHVDSNADALTESVTSPDLFGGELFGDELMDMYNSAEEVGHDMMHSGKSSSFGYRYPCKQNAFSRLLTKIAVFLTSDGRLFLP